MVDVGKLNRRITFLRLETEEDEMEQSKSERTRETNEIR